MITESDLAVGSLGLSGAGGYHPWPALGSNGRAGERPKSTDLSNLLNSQQREAQANAPDAMSILGSMLDQNKDGSALDDLQRMAANFFK
jgi:hypothetical protein